MRKLIDEREPITTAEIDQAQYDAAAWLAAPPAQPPAPGTPDTRHLVARLAAIVEDTYGNPYGGAPDG